MSSSLGSLAGQARSFPSGSTVEMWVTLAVVFWVLLFMMAIRKSSDAMGQPLVSQIRWIAQEPLPERHDPRFKEWKDVRTRFPAGAERVGESGDDSPQVKPVRAAGVWFWRPLGRVCGLAWGKLRKAFGRTHFR